ncbi:hypothetical protein H4R20_001492 [Coemansia guatemalensis]|uniref:RED-like N-terminal domain-containing protein n=1 Tax=Coemansia guatemalensis TaxID=2761395 RepID=A0A9W8LT65_9FUNG|nr:hypothetical protein H4R20_001492 [Coemansia guatemalensis]
MSNDHNQGLSQSDFRKLLQTPQASGTGDGSTEDRGGSSHRRSGILGKRRMQHHQQVVANPTVIPSDPAKRKKAAGNRTHHSRSQQQQQQKYRDRAAERRQQGTTAEPTHGIPETPSWSAGPMSASSELRDPGTMSTEQRALYEQSKYLGGDLEHTHLVKGLDFLLLEKMRKRSAGGQPAVAGAEDLDDELERLQQDHIKASPSGIPDNALNAESVKATTQLGTRVMDILQQMASAKQRRKEHAAEDGAMSLANTSVTRNELFKPGHMYFELDLSAEGVAAGSRPLVTVRLRSQEEVEQILGGASETGENGREDIGDSHVVSRVISAISLAYQKRRDWRQIKEMHPVSRATQPQQNAQDHELSTKPASLPKPQYIDRSVKEALEEEDEDDIFAEAGIDYEVTITAPKTSGSDIKDTHTGPEMPPATRLPDEAYDSDDAEMVVEPYPESPKGNSDDDMVVEPYPESPKGSLDDEEAVVAPYPDNNCSNNFANMEHTAGISNPFGEYQSESESD